MLLRIGTSCSRDAWRLIRSLGLAVILPSLSRTGNWCKQAIVLGCRCRRSAVKQLSEIVLDRIRPSTPGAPARAHRRLLRNPIWLSQ